MRSRTAIRPSIPRPAGRVAISATQTDGSVNTYSGTYTVENGVITSANIEQTS
jgi:hypothetical protein